MTDFDNAAKQTLESEQAYAAADAKYNPAFVVMVCGVIPVVVVALGAIRSLFFDAKFDWTGLWLVVGGLAAVYVGAWVYYRFHSPQKMRDERLIRIELKLDRLLRSVDDLSDLTDEQGDEGSKIGILPLPK